MSESIYIAFSEIVLRAGFGLPSMHRFEIGRLLLNPASERANALLEFVPLIVDVFQGLATRREGSDSKFTQRTLTSIRAAVKDLI